MNEQERINSIYNRLASFSEDELDTLYSPGRPGLLSAGCSFRDYLYNSILISEQSFCQVISAQKASGMTTELLKLKHNLEEDNYFVVYCPLKKLIHLQDVHYVDIMLAILKCISEKLFEKNIFIYYTKLGDVNLSEIKDFIPFRGQSFEVKFSMTSEYMKYSEHLRARIRALFDQQAFTFYRGLNEILDDIRQNLKANNYKDLIILIDDLDKCILSAEEQSNTLDTFLIDHNIFLKELNAKVLMTIPFDRLIAPDTHKLLQVLDNNIVVLPNLIQQAENKDESIDTFLREMLSKRVQSIDLSVEEIINQPALERLLYLSSGNPGQFLRLLQQACQLSATLPVEEKSIDNAAKLLKETMLRHLPQGFIEKLKQETQSPDTFNITKHKVAFAGNYLFYTAGKTPSCFVNTLVAF
jgi:hypothetical protein